jgi:hypothetical protein
MNYKKISIVAILIILMLTLLSNCTPSVELATASYCSYLTAYMESLRDLKSIDPLSPLSTYEWYFGQVTFAHAAFNEAALKLQGAKTDAAESAYQQFQKDLQSIPPNTPIEEARPILKKDLLALAQELETISTTSCNIVLPTITPSPDVNLLSTLPPQ